MPTIDRCDGHSTAQLIAVPGLFWQQTGLGAGLGGAQVAVSIYADRGGEGDDEVGPAERGTDFLLMCV